MGTVFGIVTLHCDALQALGLLVRLEPGYRARLMNVWYWCSVTLIGVLTVYSSKIARRVTLYIWEIDDILKRVELRLRKIYHTYDCRVYCKRFRRD